MFTEAAGTGNGPEFDSMGIRHLDLSALDGSTSTVPIVTTNYSIDLPLSINETYVDDGCKTCIIDIVSSKEVCEMSLEMTAIEVEYRSNCSIVNQLKIIDVNTLGMCLQDQSIQTITMPGPLKGVTLACDYPEEGQPGITSIKCDDLPGVSENNCKRTYRSTDDNTCKDFGMDMIIPRSKNHWEKLVNRYGSSYFSTIPGISKPAGGGSYTNKAMNSDTPNIDYQALDGGDWWLRDSTFSEPNGDYTANCWLGGCKC